jgi:hypothetical protein
VLFPDVRFSLYGLKVRQSPSLLSDLDHLFLEAACLCHHRTRRSALISPVRRQDTDRLVVAAEAVDAGFDEDKAELGVFVLAVALEVLADGHGLRQSMRTKHEIFPPQLEWKF